MYFSFHHAGPVLLTFGVPKVKIESVFSVDRRGLYGDAHLFNKLRNVGQSFLKKRNVCRLLMMGVFCTRFGANFRHTGSGIRVRF